MKFVSFLISLLIHVLFTLIFLLIIKTPTVVPKKIPVYTVNLLQLKNKKVKIKAKKHPKILVKKLKKKQTKPKKIKPKVVSIKPKPKRSSEERIEQPKPKLKPKPKPKPVPKHKAKPKYEHKPKPRSKTKHKQKPKPRTKNKFERVNVEKKVELLREKIMLEQVKERLLREKINEIRQHVLSEEEAQRRFSQKLASSYIALIRSIIYRNWGVAKDIIENNVFVAKVEIKLDYRGNLVKLYMIKSSGNAYFDGTVMNAIKSSEPFPPPPKEILRGGVVDFIITFDSREKQ